MMSGLLTNRRVLLIALLGFSSSLPLALTGSTLQAWFTESGMSLLAIGSLSLIGLPYIWKFLWSPLVDRFVPPFLGRRRGWIAMMQLLLCLTLFWLAHLSPDKNGHLMGWLALAIAFFSATQDIAIDAYRTDTLLISERGMGSGLFIFMARMALLVGGGLALIVADQVGWQWTYEIMAGLMALSMGVTLLAPEAPIREAMPKPFLKSLVEPFHDLLSRNGILAILLFIVLYKLGDALALSLMSTFLLRDLGFSLTEVGFISKTVGLIANITGALVGAALLNRMGLFRALLYLGFAQALSNLLFMVLALTGKNYSLMAFSLCIENFCSGMSATALVVFLTALCNRQYSATQYACLSALASVGRVFLGPLASVMVNHLGWPVFYAWSVALCFPSLLLLIGLRRRVISYAEAVA